MEFDRIREEMESYDSLREEVIKRSRDILKASKHAIYSLHRGEDPNALFEKAKSVMDGMSDMLEEQPMLANEGSFKQALEEYAEAKSFEYFLKKGELLPISEVQVAPEEYLKALSDLTGELHRYAVNKATGRDREAVEKIREFVDRIYGELSKFDFRNSELRRKYDSIKYNLQKLEQLRYELSQG